MTGNIMILAALLCINLFSVAVVADNNNNNNNSTSRVNVHIPFQLHQVHGYPHVQANFGVSHYSQQYGSISEYVYAFFPQTSHVNLCSPVVSFNQTMTAVPNHTGALKPPFILLVMGNNNNNGVSHCSAVTKARHAQQLGAAALVIANDHCLCNDVNCTTMFPNDTTTCLDHAPPLVNDGSGADVSIPTFLVYKQLAHILHQTLVVANQPVLMNLEWGLPPTTTNEADALPLYASLTTTAHDPYLNLETYQNLRLVLDKLQGKVHFRPRYALIDGTRFHCQQDNGGQCDHLCTNHGRYCTTHARNLSGFAIVRESLRRLCIWKHYVTDADEKNVNPNKWWDYILYHKQYCSDPHLFAADECLQDSQAHAGIDNLIITECMTDSGNVDEDTTNSLLEEEMNHQKETSVISLPAISINRHVLDSPSLYLLFEHVCWQYFSATNILIPDACLKCASCPNKIGCLQQGHCVEFQQHTLPPPSSNHGGGSKARGWKRFFWFWTAVAAFGGALYYYMKLRQEDGNHASLGHYLQLRGGEGE